MEEEEVKSDAPEAEDKEETEEETDEAAPKPADEETEA